MYNLRPTRDNLLFIVAVSISVFSSISVDASAQTAPITSSGLNTQVSAPIAVGTQTQYNITGGTRPGGGTNLFYSFGNFNVPNNNIANFLNGVSFDVNGNSLAAGLQTSNILARVTAGNLSSIYGTIQTTGFGNANLFLMNPAGFLFGPNATINVGGMVAFTTADYLRLADGVRFNAIPDATADALLSTAPVAAYGFLGSNPGAITVQGSQLSVTDGAGLSLVGGNITIQSGTPEGGTAQPARLSAPNGKIQLASAASPGEFDAATLQPLPNVDGASFTSFGSVSLAPGSNINVSGSNTVSIRGGQFVLSVNDAVLSTSQTAGPPETISLSLGSSIISSNAGTDPGADVQLIASNLQMDGAIIQSLTSGDGPGGAISIDAHSLNMANEARIDSRATGFGPGGPINITASSVDINGAQIFSSVMPPDFVADRTDGPPITLNVDNLNIRGGGSIAAESTDVFAALQPIVSGIITINATGTVTVSGSIPFRPGSRIESRTDGGAVGDIVINTKNLLVTDGARINSDASFGLAGQILINASDSVTVSDGGKIRMDTSFSGGGLGLIDIGAHNIEINQAIIQTQTVGEGDAGAVHLHGENITLAGGQINTLTEAGLGRGGDVRLDATNKISIRGQFAGNAIDNPGPAGIFTTTALFDGAAGNISIKAGRVEISDGARISSNTIGGGNAGNILVKADSVSITNGAQITSSSAIGEFGEIPSGGAGNVTIQGLASPAQFVLIDGAGSGIFTDTQGTGAGGNIFVNANTVMLQNGGTLSAATSGTEANATGGSVTVAATGQVWMRGGASVTASSTGPADAGNISINAGQQLDMHDSSIKTEAAQASGGNIDIRAVDRVSLVNSTISTSVLGGSGGGGNITIDPTLISLQNNSNILAQAVLGNGGNIQLIANLLLVDPSSVISASSEFGQSGTIQGPTSNLAGTVSALPSSTRQGQALQAQRCAVLSGRGSSSFIIAGRDQVPTEPGGWMVSSIDALATGEGSVARGKGEGLSGSSGSSGSSGLSGSSGSFGAFGPKNELDQTNQIDQIDQMDQSDHTNLPPVLSLRRLTPAGFLTQRFAEGEPIGCRS